MSARSPRCRCTPVVALVTLWASATAATPSSPDVQPDRAQTPVTAAIEEASLRFSVPIAWIREVVRAESAGDANAVSSAGAMGLMQIMPATYAYLRRRYGLGPDAFAVRDNILAGSAYLRELHDRYGALGMLAAYHAGPGRWENYLATGQPLPRETQRYLARLSPAVAPGAAAASPSLGMLRPSPFAAPIFIVRSAAALPDSGAPTRGRTTVDAPSTSIEPALPTIAVQRNAGGPAAPRAGVSGPASSTTSALFVGLSSREAPQ